MILHIFGALAASGLPKVDIVSLSSPTPANSLSKLILYTSALNSLLCSVSKPLGHVTVFIRAHLEMQSWEPLGGFEACVSIGEHCELCPLPSPSTPPRILWNGFIRYRAFKYQNHA